MNWRMLHALFVLVFLFNNGAESQSIIKTLPGYNSGTLPFKLETGYIGVGEYEQVQLFYYFIESERNPKEDPLVLWLAGGPGCTGFYPLVFEFGPIKFDISSFNGSLPSFILNPYSWTKIANIIFLDQPAGTGFSYSNTSEGYHYSDRKAAKDVYTFLRKWLLNHPMFIKNRLYVGAESYGGKLAPMVALKISQGIEAGLQPLISLQGYFIGNPFTYGHNCRNEQIPFAHRMALISDEYFEQAKVSCNGEYLSPDPSNAQCNYVLRLINECIENVHKPHILEPECESVASVPNDFGRGKQLLEDDSINPLLLPSEQDRPRCRDHIYALSGIWANDPTVQDALHTRKGTIVEWTKCNDSISHEHSADSVVPYHKLLSKKRGRALVYSGDHDMIVPYTATLQWIRDLNLTVDEDWRPWIFNGQVAGYTKKYKNNEFDLTFATVKGAGHLPPEYNPKECFAMVDRWLSLYPI